MSLKVDRKNPPTKGDKPMPEPVRPCEPADKPEQTRTAPSGKCGQHLSLLKSLNRRG